MLIQVFNRSTPILPGSPTTVLRLRLVPRPGEAWRFFSQNFGLVFRGRFETIGAGMSSIAVRIAPETIGAPTGLDANIGSVSSTTISQGTSYILPIVDFLQSGTSTEVSILHLVLGVGCPLSSVKVLEARPGIGYVPGDDILKMPDRILAW